ncbi:MAG TPA: radical SAM protein, partial [Chloroflexota bacterium]|nr:radical SAM protein [Chloroflexota bacterium]
MKEKLFDEYFADAPTAVNVPQIREQWLALSPPYDVERWLLPLPVWGQRPYEHNGAAAWQTLRVDLAHAASDRPFCIYLHAPFCSSKCHFCDCYSFKLGAHQTEHIQNYVNRVCAELQLWGCQGNLSQRPVSTVHMGGGTPTFLGEVALTQIVECCRAHFTITDDTEWALESTVESLTPGMIATMHQLGYRRLHLGVQSLEELVRAAINRRRPVTELLARIEQTLALGWVVSVDLVCGLPEQTLAGFVDDIQTLIAAGVNGFSLYELLIYPQNQKWAESLGLTQRRHVPNYFMFQAGASVLESHGFHKSLFNHWADGRDQNIYFTFPTRGEDCLAIGTIADGVLGDYHYRHPRYAAYMRQCGPEQPGLEGGLRRTAGESALLPMRTAVLSGTIPPQFVPILQAMTANGQSLLHYWQQQKLIQPGGNGGYVLTANGGWFA